MVLVAGNRDRGEARRDIGERGQQTGGVLVGEHADDEVQLASGELVGGEEGADGFSGAGIVAAVEPGFAFGRERGEQGAVVQVLEPGGPVRPEGRGFECGFADGQGSLMAD